MSEDDPLEDSLVKALDKENEPKQRAHGAKSTQILGDIRTIALILSLAANVWLGYLKLQEARERSEAGVRKDVESNISRILTQPDKGHEAELTLLAPHVKRDGPYLAEILSAYETRLNDLHSTNEGRIIFEALGNAGPDGLVVALNANRQAYGKLLDTVSGDAVYHVTSDDLHDLPSNDELWEIIGGDSDIEGPNRNLVKELFDLRQSLACAKICVPGTYQVSKELFDREINRLKSSDINPRIFHDELQILVEILRDSRGVTEKLLPVAPCENDVIRVHGVFMPTLKAPASTYHCHGASFDQSYIYGADLTGLAPSVQKLDFQNTVDNADPYRYVAWSLNDTPPPKYLTRSASKSYMNLTSGQAKWARFYDDK